MYIYNVNQHRKEFPSLHQTVYGKQLVYFDNAATTLKPQSVIREISRFYEEENSNIHRGTHYLSLKATEEFEDARSFIADFINAEHSHEVIFVKGATEAINLVADTFGQTFLEEGDEILISSLEHHSNIVPWQIVCKKRKANLRAIPLLPDSSLDLDAFKSLLGEKTKLVAITHVSNALGIINPLKEIIELAHNNNIPVLVDGAQGIVHSRVDVRQLDCDFYCFSGHKLYGPMGIGILYGKEKYLEMLPPYQGGGEMIQDVSFQKSSWNVLPFKFEAGTPNVAAVLGMRKAIEYLNTIGFERIFDHERNLLDYTLKQLDMFSQVSLYGSYLHKAGIISFNIKDTHHYDAGVMFDKMGIALRTGHHCTQPLMDLLGVPGTVRISFGLYNSTEEVDVFIQALKKVIQLLS